MLSQLQRFTVHGLHGRRTIDVSLEENTLILVGENGSGKTTFLRILFHFLSGQWLTLVQFKFESISAVVMGQRYVVTHEQITNAFKATDRRVLQNMPPSLRRRVSELINRGELDKVAFEVQRYDPHLAAYPELLYRQLDIFGSKGTPLQKELQETIQKIRHAINAQVLYLPTYRRIERELNSIFEGADPDELRRKNARIAQPESVDYFIELVEFGMKDVKQAIDKALAGLKEFARESLNNLTLKYLGDVVNREYLTVGLEFASVSEETVKLVLDRIDENILNKAHKEHLFGVINASRSAGAPSEHEKIIYHYFLKLLHFQEALQVKERQIADFCQLCSTYIVDKRFVYDSAAFTFSIVPVEEHRQAEKAIDLGDLSSGEKQIVSLFSHLYLSGQVNFFVLIDEPELSLSVPWQRRFLTDIRGGDFCRGLVAVTHSPFIYDNELRPFAHALGEFMR